MAVLFSGLDVLNNLLYFAVQYLAQLVNGI